MSVNPITRNEDLRQLEHLSPIVFAFLLKYLTWSQALIFALMAIVYALYVSPRYLPMTQRPNEVERGFSGGKIAYAVSVFLLILLFPNEEYLVAAVWANLSVGDAVSNVIGRRFGKKGVPWNRQKTFVGMFTAIVAASTVSTILILWTGLPPGTTSATVRALLYGSATSIVCSIIETIPLPVDDNISICIGGSSFLYWLSHVKLPGEVIPERSEIGVGAVVLAGLVAYISRTVTLGGMISGMLLGTAVVISFGFPGFILLGTFFIIGTMVSKIGYGKKLSCGIAQPDFSRRTARHVWGKGFAPLIAAIASFFIDSKEFASLAYVSAVSASLFDTIATELGQLVGKHPILLHSFKHVTPGSPGAVSLEGSIIGFLGASVIGVEGFLVSMITVWGMVWAMLASCVAVHLESLLAGVSEDAERCSGELLNAFHTTIAMLIGILLGRIQI